MATTRKTAARKAPERYEIEWTTNVPVDECGDGDPDAGTDNVEYRDTKAEAIAFARSVVAADYWGCPRVYHQRRQLKECYDGGPLHETWETIGNLSEEVI